MPLNRDNFSTTLRSGNTSIKITDLETSREDSKNESIAQSSYFPRVIDDIKTSNQSDINVLGNINEYILLVSQTTESENGLYLQNTTSSTTKQTMDNKNQFFMDSNGIRAIFHNNINVFTQVFYDHVHLSETITTTATTQIDIFDIPVIPNRPTVVYIELLGYRTADYSESIHADYRRSIYNNGGTHIDIGNLETKVKRTTSGPPIPTITFSATSPSKLKLTPGDTTSTKWFIKGRLSF